jgi:hypothetical protein
LVDWPVSDTVDPLGITMMMADVVFGADRRFNRSVVVAVPVGCGSAPSVVRYSLAIQPGCPATETDR